MNRVFTSRHLAAFLILLLALALAPAIALAQSGYVTASALYMREEPLLDAKVVATLHQGDKVEITGKSSNGKVLFDECLRVNPNSHLIEGPEEIQPAWLKNVNTVGICGATSTPKWLMEQCRDAIMSSSSTAATD